MEITMTLEALLHNPNALPSAPKVVEELISSFDNPSVSTEEIARKLKSDPVLAAKLLKLANSAYYHVSRSIGSVDDAVRMLGFVTVRTLVISSGLVSGFKTVPGLDLKRFWRYSLHAAVASKWVAKKSGENTDLAFTIGMMHAIGQLVIHAGNPVQAQELDKEADPYADERLMKEKALLGYEFAEVGSELALRWKFPAVFIDTLRQFPTPLGDHAASGIASCVHLGVWRARAEENRVSGDALAATLPTDVVSRLGLQADHLLKEMPSMADLSAGLEELVN